MADESKQLPEAWRVEKVNGHVPLKTNASGGIEVVLTPVYYGPDEDGPKVGDILVPGKVKA
jgi:hypothetical protein